MSPSWINTLLKNDVMPNEYMTVDEKKDAWFKLIFIVALFGYILTKNNLLLLICICTFFYIFTTYKLKQKENVFVSKEAFQTKADKDIKKTTNPITLESVLRSEFHSTTKKNPFGNVLLTDIGDKPDRKAAAPSFNPDVYDEINSAVKKQTQMLNPEIINTNKQLYGDLYDNYQLDNALMRFYSTANTRVTNDQGAFSKWLYGDMYSSKEDSPEGALMRVKNNWQWINP